MSSDVSVFWRNLRSALEGVKVWSTVVTEA